MNRGRRVDVRSVAAPVGRVAVTIVMLVWLSNHVHLSQLRVAVWRPMMLVWLAAALGVTLIGIVLSALRWQRVLVALDLPVRVSTLLRHYLAGLFVGNFLPTTIGGDVVRVRRLAADNGETAATTASVVLERLTGWLVLPLLTIIALIVNPGLQRRAPGPAATAMTVAVGTLVLLAALLLVASNPWVGRRTEGREGWRRFTGAIHLGLDRARRNPGLAFEICTVGFAYQLAVMLSAFLAAKTLGLDVGWTAILAFFPVVAIVQVLPLTVSGLGTREAALVFFLQPLGVAPADAFALGLLVYFVNLGVSLLGAPAFAVGSRARRTASRAVA
ncbi:MAG TPA: lysylphosphatidylglycerol synthase transmembrane domain-containing protein [Acidimicrobiales bacterium]|nr:lysylphosphatidylglycerol synthase transmembrane domain-containing protein [Acidimicrobiales bacterium]